MHFDPINLAALVIVIGTLWYQYVRQNDKSSDASKWHTDWIKKHSAECDEQRKQNAEILTELQTTNTRLATLTEGHEKRIDRLEQHADQRAR